LNVTFHGVRGSAPVPGPGNLRYGTHTACVALEAPEEDPLVLDLGSGLRRWAHALAGDSEDAAAPLRAVALLSHLHWGHVQGLPDFEPLDHPGTVLDIFGPRPDQGPLARMVTDTLAPPWFRERFDERPGTVRFHEVGDEEILLGPDTRVTVRSVPHGAAVTNGYRVERNGVSVAYVSDHDPPPDLDGVAPGVLEVADGVDLLIHDAQLSAADWPGRAGRGHSTVGYALLVAREAGAHRLALFHHDPDRDDDELDRLLEVARRGADRPGPGGPGVDEVVSAYEGLTLCLEGA
jgi:phosphoribosyl 1,2-cyclic phosphodiesterase